jgi:hypothetical protein
MPKWWSYEFWYGSTINDSQYIACKYFIIDGPEIALPSNKEMWK